LCDNEKRVVDRGLSKSLIKIVLRTIIKIVLALLAVMLVSAMKTIGSSQAGRAIRTAALGASCLASTCGLSTG
jgi:hypothetical protein